MHVFHICLSIITNSSCYSCLYHFCDQISCRHQFIIQVLFYLFLENVFMKMKQTLKGLTLIFALIFFIKSILTANDVKNPGCYTNGTYYFIFFNLNAFVTLCACL